MRNIVCMGMTCVDEIIILADRWVMRMVIPSAETLGISSFKVRVYTQLRRRGEVPHY